MNGNDFPTSRTGASRWGLALLGIDRVWTRFETAVVVGALALELGAMSLWVFLKGVSTPADNESHGGIVLRALIGACVLGAAVYAALRRAPARVRVGGTLASILVAAVVSPRWASVGVDYGSNLLNWFQQASFLTLLGGLRGVGTRLTLLLALVGGSLATARGKHVVIDIVTRLVHGRRRAALVVSGWLVSAVVTLAAAWGFFDHVAIENFGARADATAGAKARQVLRQLGEDWFIVTRQLALDARAAPHVVLHAEPYSEWLRGRDWNLWVESAGFAARYGAEAARALDIPDDDFRPPLVVIPGRGEPRGELTSAGNLVFPFGLLVIALRFVLRGLLVAAGCASAVPDDSDERAVAPLEAQPARSEA